MKGSLLVALAGWIVAAIAILFGLGLEFFIGVVIGALLVVLLVIAEAELAYRKSRRK